MKFAVSVCIFASVLLIPAALFAQDTASITGTVTDSSGATIPNAQVTITSAEHGINRMAPTNGSGDYTFAALPIGAYDLAVSAPGFKKYEAKNVILRVSEKARANVAMQVGSADVQVTVEGTSVAQVETQSSDLGDTVSGKEVTQLELNGRDFKQLVTLVPGVSNQTGEEEGNVGVAANTSYSINGGRTEYNNWELDGGDTMDNGSNNTLNVTPSVDAIAEFKVETSNYGAQYGRNGSGTIEVETKSGASAFHGDLYEFVRNDKFNATRPLQTSVAPYKKNDFGYTLGGPIFIPHLYNQNRQRTFFFWSQEWKRDRVPASFGSIPVPTVAERGGNFNDVCPASTIVDTVNFPSCPVDPSSGQYFLNNQVPINDSATVAGLEGLIPLPNLDPTTWLQTPTLPTNWREELFRVDHNVTDKVRASFLYVHDSWDQIYPTPLWTSGTAFPTVQTNFKGPGISMVAHLTAEASPTLLNEFVASYTTDHITTQLVGSWQRPSGYLPVGLYNNGFGNRVTGISLGGNYSFSQDPGYVPNGALNSNPTYGFKDNLTKVLGPHNLQLGAYVVIAQKNEIPQPGTGTNGILFFDSTSATVSSGNAFADLLLGNPTSFSQEKAALKMYERYKIFEPYFQDDWRATSRLTLNLGLRMSFFGTYSEKYRNAWNFDPTHYVAGASGINPDGTVSGNPLNGWVDCGVTPGVPAGCMKNHWFNPAPRIGFAYDPTGNGKWSIRGGYGIFFEHTNGNESNTESLEQYNPLTETASATFNGGGPVGYANITPALLGNSTTPLTFVSLPNQAVWPYIQQWHADIQHDIGKNTVATLSYVGSAGVHLTRTYEYNQVAPVPASQNPYAPGETIDATDPNTGLPHDDCGSLTTSQGVAITGQAAINLAIACGNDASPYRPFVGVGSIIRKDQSGSSNYHALEASIRHSIGGLQLNGAYTYSHSIDNSSDGADSSFVNAYNLNAYRASSNFDQRHVFNLGYVYDLPFFKSKGLANRLLGGWEWSGIANIQSGTPFSVYNGGAGPVPGDNAGVANNYATGGSYPDLVGDPRKGVQNAPVIGVGPLYYNPAAFAAPRGLTFGNAGRNILRNPSRTNFDMALLKHFALTESKYFEFRVEAFNVFNHTEWAYIGGDTGSAAGSSSGNSNSNVISCYGGANNSAGDSLCTQTLQPGFLHPNSAHFPRVLQLALKFIF